MPLMGGAAVRQLREGVAALAAQWVAVSACQGPDLGRRVVQGVKQYGVCRDSR